MEHMGTLALITTTIVKKLDLKKYLSRAQYIIGSFEKWALARTTWPRIVHLSPLIKDGKNNSWEALFEKSRGHRTQCVRVLACSTVFLIAAT